MESNGGVEQLADRLHGTGFHRNLGEAQERRLVAAEAERATLGCPDLGFFQSDLDDLDAISRDGVGKLEDQAVRLCHMITSSDTCCRTCASSRLDTDCSAVTAA